MLHVLNSRLMAFHVWMLANLEMSVNIFLITFLKLNGAIVLFLLSFEYTLSFYVDNP